MANVDAGFGFVPIRHMSGNAPRTNKYTIGTGLAENIFKGDLVIVVAAGTITPGNGSTEISNIGVFDGCSYTASDGSYVYSEYWPSGTAATNIIAYVYDDPFTVFKIQSAGTPAQEDIMDCADVTVVAGSTTTGQSKTTLTGAMSATSACCKIIAIHDTPDNAFGEFAVLEVLINEHLLAPNTAGI